jgi:hypothetical protein
MAGVVARAQQRARRKRLWTREEIVALWRRDAQFFESVATIPTPGFDRRLHAHVVSAHLGVVVPPGET